ncbi:hypothetical protein [Nocardiopsis sp. CC223A]|uniref:hypothetical protein n=1 Tax=Nocardiopsis sp. CC223A TaxID=3044051 RepID=UPI00278C1BEA|nr:hypothetical protein [Nocardiopsis sp. CC223A]
MRDLLADTGGEPSDLSRRLAVPSEVRPDHERALRSQAAIEDLYARGLVLDTTPRAIGRAHALLRESGTLPA